MKKRIRVAILFGGKSAEHEVSLQSAKSIVEALDTEKYEPILVGIDKSGRWLLPDQSNSLLHTGDPKLIKLNKGADSVALVPQSNGVFLNMTQNKKGPTVDVVFPALHGPFGEDGTTQGLLKLANVPFVGAGVLGSAVGMDKDVQKRLLKEARIRVARFSVFHSGETVDAKTVAEEFGLPLFVKPANLGSSVGITKVKKTDELSGAIQRALQYDRKVLVEECIDGREIECAVLGNDHPQASVPGEVIVHDDFYSYEAKYVDEHGAALEIPAKIPAEIAATLQRLALTTFAVLGCEGMARVDFFLKPGGEALVNELNTIPGFTKISMYPKLWEASGMPYPELIDLLIQLAIERFEKEQKLKTSYETEIGHVMRNGL